MTGTPMGRLTSDSQFRSAIDRLFARVDSTAREVGSAFPLAADPDTGRWLTAVDGRWAGGFWGGMLWLAAHAGGADRHRTLAASAVATLASRVALDNVLNGLVFYYGAALGHRLCADAQARSVALAGARALSTHFNPAAGIFPLGRDSGSLTADHREETNIDGLPGMSLLCWAGNESNAPALTEQGLSHCRQHARWCLRVDGSLFQAALFDRDSGEPTRRFSPRGFASETSTWARAQSWGLLGFVQMHAWSGDTFFLDAAIRAADWWLQAVPEDRVAWWDFDDPAIPHTERDTSATAMAAAALLKLAPLAPAASRTRYRDAAVATLEALVRHHLTPIGPADTREPGRLLDGCWQRNQNQATRHELIWGDYFLFESLLMVDGCIDRVI